MANVFGNGRLIDDFRRLTGQPVRNCVVTGYPKLDAYLDENPSQNQRRKPLIVYAPYHSFKANGLVCATFQFNGHEIFELAKAYKNSTDWVFRPHPRFKTAVIKNGIMTEREIDDYYASWEEIGTIYDSGNYFDLFRSSAALITDCCSFLGEYLPTGKPIFSPTGPNRS